MPNTSRAYTKRPRLERRPLGLSLPPLPPPGELTLEWLRSFARSIPANMPDSMLVIFAETETRVVSDGVE